VTKKKKANKRNSTQVKNNPATNRGGMQDKQKPTISVIKAVSET
jgi:hypothetical protein